MTKSEANIKISIRKPGVQDIPLIYRFILRLAEFEKLLHEVVATEGSIRETLFQEKETSL